MFSNNKHLLEFPDEPVDSTRHFHCQGLGLIPGHGTKIPQAEQLSQNNNNNKNSQIVCL